MKIAVVDADFIGRKNHRFPNLCCMKISGYHKRRGDAVTLKTDYCGFDNFDRVFVAKVFTDTPVPDGGLFPSPLDARNVTIGGTGFFYDNAPPLPYEIEHSMPDYHLYDGVADFKTFTDYSIGYLTRGCFRHCKFCVNRRSNFVVAASPLEEFFDPSRKKICLLDDNFFGFDGWKDLLIQLRKTGKPFVFKQGLDIRLLDEQRAKLLFSSNYDGDFIFAFDDAELAPLIEEKIQLIGRYVNLNHNCVKFYVLCAFDRADRYDENFLHSPNPRAYTQIARWCNQPHLFLKMSFADFLTADANYRRNRHETHYQTKRSDNAN